MSNDKLASYKEKRAFDNTGEPESGSGRQCCFVIQKHDASRLHYDFRLAVNGVLKSWAVPKGPSTDPADKRLAIQVEDHPLDYADFEGTIPEGEYGAGEVIVWDRGRYRNLRAGGDDDRDMAASLDDGLIEVELAGEKLRGGYALKRIEDGDKPKWLLIKMDDEEADARRKPTSTEPESVKSGRTIEDLADDD